MRPRRHRTPPGEAPPLARPIQQLNDVFDYLEQIGAQVYRLPNQVLSPALRGEEAARAIDASADALAALGARARTLGLRLSVHSSAGSSLAASTEEGVARAIAEVEAHTALLDALGCGPDATVVVHVRSHDPGRDEALEAWTAGWERLSGSARRRLGLENGTRRFNVGDVLELHRRTGVRVVYDWHHDRCNPTLGLPAAEALAAALATWADGVRPKVHISSVRTAVDSPARSVRGRRGGTQVPLPELGPHADLVSPFDFLELIRAARQPIDVMLEGDARDLALLWLRRQLERVAPDVAAAEERLPGEAATPTGESPARRRARPASSRAGRGRASRRPRPRR